MSLFRTRLLALLGASLLITFSATAAFAAPPERAHGEDANHGQQVSAFVHGLLFGSDESEDADEESVEEDVEEEVEEELDEEEVDGETPDNHGQCVREFAHSDEVGGPNENHGFVVSEAARVTCRDTDTPEETDEQEAVEETEEVEETSTDEVDDGGGRGKSAAAHERNAQRKAANAAGGRGHGRGGRH
ncbi:MAG TPA: hypothetical protein VHK28_05505 [Candidatus Limnocylindria bacterium]|nr:hypothetical protein [Candidatus Limnocylindria bacterium]